MASGPQTTIYKLSHKLLQRWVPKWYEAFVDHKNGGFHERLGHGFQPIYTGKRRLLTHCRQMSIYAHAAVQPEACAFKPDLTAAYDHLMKTFYVADSGGFRCSVDDQGQVLDETYDLYAHAFVIFALSHYYKATQDERARDTALGTLGFIDEAFRIEGIAGLSEALDMKRTPLVKTRRHESHMHLLEACLFAYEVWDDAAYMVIADEIVQLFFHNFYDADKNMLPEYYTADLKPYAEDGTLVCEPGHYCEWIWLLKKYGALRDDPAQFDDVCAEMLDWANAHGWDDEYGGIFDELDPEGGIVQDTKRLWPFSESLKANALMLDSGMDKDKIKAHYAKMVAVFEEHYIDDRGFWTEWLSRDLKPATDYMPGTTPYHVYFGITEARDVLKARGRSRSLRAMPEITIYSWRQKLSAGVRKIRMGLKG